MTKILILLLVTSTIIAFSSCHKDENNPKTHLIVSVDSLNFGETGKKVFFITTEPESKCPFEIISYPDWVQVSPTSGDIDSNLVTINVTPTYGIDVPGVYTGKLVILTTLGTDTVYLKGIVKERLLYSIPDTVSISVFADSKILPIVNYGNMTINYSAIAGNSMISLGSETGTIIPGVQGEIQVDVNRQFLETGTYYSKIFLTINNVVDTVEVKIEEFKEKKTLLDSDVTDAEYNKGLDIMAYVSAQTSRLYVYHAISGVTNSLELPYVPTCISMAADGNTAVIGHDAHVTYVNLSSMSIINAFDVTANSIDIVLGNNQYAYVLPKYDQWTDMHCLNLLTGVQTMQSGSSIYAGTLGRMHPSGKYIYAADNGISPSDVHKFNIQNGTATYMYDSPYHGDYPMSGNLWFSEDGYRIFTRGKTVLKTSSLQESDMVYNGSITLEQTNNQIRWLDHSAGTNNLYLISSADDYWNNNHNKPFVYVYNASNLVFRYKMELEKYMVPDNQGGGSFYAPEPFFVFSDSSGHKLFVLVKAAGSGLVYEWSLQKLEIR